MFTGLIQHTGVVAALEGVEFGAHLWLDPRGWAHRPSIGDSIAVDGCCLTVAAIDPRGWRFDVIRQTIEVTALAGWMVGRRVNLEHSATPTTMLGGHVVQGHIDGVGTVERVERDATQWRVRVSAPPPVMRLVVDRGSVTLDGVSLTVAGLEPSEVGVEGLARPTCSTCPTCPTWFEVALIPTTLRETNLGERRAGERVNIETDCIVRAVAHLLAWRDGERPLTFPASSADPSRPAASGSA